MSPALVGIVRRLLIDLAEVLQEIECPTVRPSRPGRPIFVSKEQEIVQVTVTRFKVTLSAVVPPEPHDVASHKFIATANGVDLSPVEVGTLGGQGVFKFNLDDDAVVRQIDIDRGGNPSPPGPAWSKKMIDDIPPPAPVGAPAMVTIEQFFEDDGTGTIEPPPSEPPPSEPPPSEPPPSEPPA